MEKVLRILILEDCITDVDLMEFELQEAKIPFVSKRVEKEKDYVRALKKCSPDLILSDYDLPQYKGSLALAEAKSCCPGTPFILVTGARDENLAKEIISQGADDFVNKSELHKLAPTVQRVLQLASYEDCF